MKTGLGVSFLCALALVAPAFAYPLLLVNILCFAILALGFNLLAGYARLISFGHTAYVGTAAYVTGHLLASQGWPTELGLLAGVFASAGLGVVFGLLAIRRRGMFFGMVTLAQSQLVYFLFLNASFTGGENGLQGVPRGTLLGVVSLANDTVLYYFALAVFVAVFVFVRRVVHSPFGRALDGIRENEARAVSMGFDVMRLKLLAFVLSAAIAGLAGSLKTLSFGLATLSDLHWTAGADVLVMVLVGGLGTLWGPVVGAALVTFLHTYLAERAPSLASGVLGVLFVICVLVLRRGLVGELSALARRGRSGAQEVAAGSSVAPPP